MYENDEKSSSQSLSSTTSSSNNNNNNNNSDPITFYPISISGLPSFIPSTGIKFFNELAYYMGNNMPPSNQFPILEKLAKIGIVPNKNLNNQSATNFNETISKSLLQGIENGEKLIDKKASTMGRVVNGWNVDTDAGKYPDNYLLRSTYAKYGLWGNNAEETIYPNTFVDSNGNPLNGSNNNNYVMHFSKEQIPQVNKDGFWSITVYNKDRLLHDNPIDRYIINDRTKNLKYNEDGSLDIYLQNKKPIDIQKETNWFPIPDGPFSLTMRIYIPTQSVLNGEYMPPLVKPVE
jgi:hypothetical protein